MSKAIYTIVGNDSFEKRKAKNSLESLARMCNLEPEEREPLTSEMFINRTRKAHILVELDEDNQLFWNLMTQLMERTEIRYNNITTEKSEV